MAAPRSLLFLRTRNARKSSGLSPQTREVFEKSTRLFRKTPPFFNVLRKRFAFPRRLQIKIPPPLSKTPPLAHVYLPPICRP